MKNFFSKLFSKENRKKFSEELSLVFGLVVLVLFCIFFIYSFVNWIVAGKETHVRYYNSIYNGSGSHVILMGLKGDVKSIITTDYTAIELFGEIEIDSITDKTIKLFYSDGRLDTFIDKMKDTAFHTTNRIYMNGVLYSDNFYLRNAKFLYKRTYKFDEWRNRIEQNNFDVDGSLMYKWKFKYDENDNNIESKGYKPDGSLESSWVKKFDDSYNVTEEEEKHTDGSLGHKYSYKYEYDVEGNWIKKIEFEKEKPKSITIREIEYYSYSDLAYDFILNLNPF